MLEEDDITEYPAIGTTKLKHPPIDLDEISKEEIIKRIEEAQKVFFLSDAFVRPTSGNSNFGNWRITFPFDTIKDFIKLLQFIEAGEISIELVKKYGTTEKLIDDFSGKHPETEYAFFWAESSQNPASESQRSQYEAENLFNKDVSNIIMKHFKKIAEEEDDVENE